VRIIFVVLDVLLQIPMGVNREDVAVTCVVIEWVSIDSVRRFLCGQNENSPCVSIRAGSECFQFRVEEKSVSSISSARI
jgi:hypothetical protein